MDKSITGSSQGTLAITGTGTLTALGTISGVTNNVIGWASIGSTPVLATWNGGVIGGLSAYQDSAVTTTWSSGADVRVGGILNVGTIAADPSMPTTLNSLTFQAENTLDLALLPATLTISSGGIISTANSGLTNGTIATGLDAVGGADLIFNTFTATNFTAASVIADGAISSGLTKTGTGSLILTRTNTYTGTTTVNAGTLVIGDGNVAGTIGSGAVVNNATIQYNRTNGFTIAGTLSGPGILTVSAGTLTLAAATTYTGTTTVAGGAALVLAAPGTTSFASSLQAGGGSVTYIGGGTLQLLATNGSFNNTFFVKNNSTLSLGDGSGGAGSVNSSTATLDIESGSTLLLNRGSASIVSFLPAVIGGGGVTKQGTGAFSMGTGSTTYTGPTNILAGSIVAAANNALGANSAVTISSGAQLTLNGFTVAIGSLSGAGVVANLLTGGAGVLDVGSLNTSTLYSGRIYGGNGTTALVKSGTGALTLSNPNNTSTTANTYTGGR